MNIGRVLDEEILEVEDGWLLLPENVEELLRPADRLKSIRAADHVLDSSNIWPYMATPVPHPSPR